MICWFCYYGWPKPIADIYDKYLAIAGESVMHYSAGHVVWDDENFDCAQACLDDFDEFVNKHREEDATDAQYEALRQSLIELAALPDSVIEPRPDYGGENPEQFPPPDGMEMVRR